MEQKNRKLMIFLAGELRNQEHLLALIEREYFDYYAADAGYLHANRLGLSPRRILGDFDSAKKPDVDGIMIYPSEKDQTDSELALELAVQDGYREVWMIAPFGGRLDHTVANLCLLEAAAEKKIDLKLYDGENLAFLMQNGRWELSPHYRYISFFPWKNDAEISLSGFKYPLDHYNLKIKQPVGVSNEPKGNPRIEIHRGSVLCVCVENIREEV